MKKLISAISVLLSVLLFLSSCSSGSTRITDSTGDDFFRGIEQGQEDIFFNLWHAAPDVELISDTDPWETDCFLLSVKKDTANKQLHFDLRSRELSLNDCFENQEILFYAFYSDRNQFHYLFNSELFRMYAELEVLTRHNATATIGIYDDIESVVMIIVADGNVYKANYT